MCLLLTKENVKALERSPSLVKEVELSMLRWLIYAILVAKNEDMCRVGWRVPFVGICVNAVKYILLKGC